jgi:hypothetical protein
MLLHEGSEDVEKGDESPPAIHQPGFGICDIVFLEISEYLSHQQRPHKLADLVDKKQKHKLEYYFLIVFEHAFLQKVR